MSAERSLSSPPPMLAGEVSGIHRFEIPGPPAATAEGEPPQRPSMRVIELAGHTPPAPGIGELVPSDLGAPELYLNRELTYLNFCWRVLHEADDDRIPLL